MKNKISILIPAKGGSTRIENKNIRLIKGKSLLGWAIDSAKLTTCRDICISTNDKNIASEALRYYVRVVIRPDSLCTATASSESAMIHFVEQTKCDAVLMLNCTCPLINSDDLQQMINKYETGAYDSVTLLEKKMLFVVRLVGDVMFPVSYNPYNRQRSQDFKDSDYTYCEAGAWLVSKEILLKNECRMGGRNGYVIKEDFNIDIDYEDDLKIAEAYLNE